jgi:hypothetical protein
MKTILSALIVCGSRRHRNFCECLDTKTFWEQQERQSS